MGDRAEKMSAVPRTNTSPDRSIVELADYLALNNAGTDRPPTMIWSKDSFSDARGASVNAEGDMYFSLPALEEARQAPRRISLALASLIGVVVVAVAALYNVSTTQTGTPPRKDSAAEEKTFKPTSVAVEKTVPLTDGKASLAEESPSKADDGTWTEMLGQYARLGIQQSRTSQDKAKQTANEQLLEGLEAWMNKGSR
jgi:hypothetical protein